jgi:hypothetical protein
MTSPLFGSNRSMVTSLCMLGLLVIGLSCAETPQHAAMPAPLVGLDVIVGPGVALSGEGVQRFPAFGNALTSAIQSRLHADGFEIVTAARDQSAVRVAIRASLDVSLSKFIIINGRPMESNSAVVGVQVIGPDGGLIDAFELSGDPEDAGLPTKVAANVAEHMKGSARLVALAQEGPRPRPSAPPPSSPPANPVPEFAGAQPAPSQSPYASAPYGGAPAVMNDARQSEPAPTVDAQNVTRRTEAKSQEERAAAPAVANDVGRPRAAGVTTVLGFELGKEVNLEPCQDGSNEDALLIAQKMTEAMGIPADHRPQNPSIAVTTACSLGVNDPGINGFLESFDLNKTNKKEDFITTLFVRLPTSDRPSWMSSAMSHATFALVLADGIAIGALIKGLHTGNSEDIVEAVSDKYPKAKHSTEPETCSNSYGASRSFKAHVWAMNGLTAMYDPIGTRHCSVTSDDVSGTLMFKTDAWLKLEKRQKVKQKALDAKL